MHIELTADNPVSFRLKIDGLISPLKFIMEPESGSIGKQMTWTGRRFSDVKNIIQQQARRQKDKQMPVEVFFSTVCKTPNIKNYELRYFSEKHFKVYSE